jgi:hypothetical protein
VIHGFLINYPMQQVLLKEAGSESCTIGHGPKAHRDPRQQVFLKGWFDPGAR